MSTNLNLKDFFVGKPATQDFKHPLRNVKNLKKHPKSGEILAFPEIKAVFWLPSFHL
jgi:hypothetical protein